jgi:hypothetical protein
MRSTPWLVTALFLAVTLYAGSDNFTLADAVLGTGRTEVVLDASTCSSKPITKDGGEFLAVKFERMGFLMSFREFPQADRGRLDEHYRIGIILGRPSFQEAPPVLYPSLQRPVGRLHLPPGVFPPPHGEGLPVRGI